MLKMTKAEDFRHFQMFTPIFMNIIGRIADPPSCGGFVIELMLPHDKGGAGR